MHFQVYRRIAVLTVSFLLLARAAHAQSADELVAKNLAARGGAAKLAAISSIQFTGKMIQPGDFQLAYRETRAANGAAKYEFTIQGLTIVQAYDGKTGWKINPFEGRRDPERMSADDTRALADDATIAGPLLDAKARGGTVTYLGREEFEGTDTYKLRVSYPSGVEYLYYLDPDTYLEIKIVETRKFRGAPQITLTEYSDYELVDGVYFPFAIESGAADSRSVDRQKTVIESARANVALTPATFAPPPAGGSK
jgi:hypothetical protein